MKFEGDVSEKSLEALEGISLGDGSDAPTDLVRRCIKLNKVPLKTFTVDDLRLMIGQQIGLRYLIPIAIELLKQDLFVEANYFPGDLLKNVLAVNNYFWDNNKDLWKQLDELIINRVEEIKQAKIPMSKFYGAKQSN